MSIPLVYHPSYSFPFPGRHRFPMEKFRLLHERLTEAGIAIHPSRPELAERARHAGLPVTTLDDLRQKAETGTNPAKNGRGTGKLVALCEAPDGQVIDEIRAL